MSTIVLQKKLLPVYCLLLAVISEANIRLNVKKAGPTGLTINVSWFFSRDFPHVEITWEAMNYISEPVQQVTARSVGRVVAGSFSSNISISEHLKLDQQYRICVKGSDTNCSVEENACSYIKVSKYTRIQEGPHLYLVLGPIHSTNASLTWAVVPKESYGRESTRTDVSYRLGWRRIDGRVGGHPGHSLNVVSFTHVVKGLQPAKRYELCVGETVRGKESQTCDVITTEEDLPGPPAADESTCYNQARGTHWRCDITWLAPKKPNGKIRGYTVSWRDQEGYTLLESFPRVVLCDSFCVDSQVLTFHPHEVCVRARTAKGSGWESCVIVADISSRILAFFDLRLLFIVLSTLFVYKFGTRIMKAILRCCVRGLSSQLETEKKHPV